MHTGDLLAQGLNPIRERWHGACGRVQGDFRFAADPGLTFRRLSRRVLRTLARVERARQRQPIVALRHGIVRLLQRVGRFGELAGGVLPSGTLRHIDVDRLQAHEHRAMLRGFPLGILHLPLDPPPLFAAPAR